MDMAQIEIPIVYEAEIIRKKCRKQSSVSVLTSMFVEIPVYDEDSDILLSYSIRNDRDITVALGLVRNINNMDMKVVNQHNGININILIGDNELQSMDAILRQENHNTGHGIHVSYNHMDTDYFENNGLTAEQWNKSIHDILNNRRFETWNVKSSIMMLLRQPLFKAILVDDVYNAMYQDSYYGLIGEDYLNEHTKTMISDNKRSRVKEIMEHIKTTGLCIHNGKIYQKATYPDFAISNFYDPNTGKNKHGLYMNNIPLKNPVILFPGIEFAIKKHNINNTDNVMINLSRPDLYQRVVEDQKMYQRILIYMLEKIRDIQENHPYVEQINDVMDMPDDECKMLIYDILSNAKSIKYPVNCNANDENYMSVIRNAKAKNTYFQERMNNVKINLEIIQQSEDYAAIIKNNLSSANIMSNTI